MLNVLELYDEQAAQKPVPKLRLVPMPEATATYLGCLYTNTPEKGKLPHPQDRPLRELWRVTGLSVTENGIYALKVSKKAGLRKISLSEAEKNRDDLEKRNNLAYGRDEVDLEPQPIPRESGLWKLFVRSYQEALPNTTCEFV